MYSGCKRQKAYLEGKENYSADIICVLLCLELLSLGLHQPEEALILQQKGLPLSLHLLLKAAGEKKILFTLHTGREGALVWQGLRC